MKQLLSRFQLALASLLFLIALSFAPAVMALSDGSGGSGQAQPDDSEKPLYPIDPTPKKTSDRGRDLAESFRQQAQTKVAEDKAKIKEHTEAERKSNCQERRQGIANRENAKVAAAKAHKAVFDRIYAKAKAFHDNKQLDTPNYAALTAAIDAAQSAAADSISALEALNVPVDCSQTNVADGVSAFQQAVKAARESLKTYRSALVDLLKALRETNSSTNNSGQ